MNYNFPGNIRELEDIIREIFINYPDGSEVTAKHIWAILNLRMLSTENEIKKCSSQEMETNENYKYIRIQDILNRLEEACQKALEQKSSKREEDYFLTLEEWAKYYPKKEEKQEPLDKYV